MKNGKNVTPIFEANMEAALRSQYHRTKDTAIDLRMPFDRMISFEEALAQEDDGIENADGENAIGDYEMRQRVIGVRAFLRWLKTRAGVSSSSSYRPGPVSNIMMQLFAAGRALQDPFFSSMSFTENGLLFSQTKAGASHRSKLLSRELEKAGMKGIQQPGQKTPESRAIYAETAKRTKNRAKKATQGSFLRKLKTGPAKPETRRGGKPERLRQQTFTRKLSSAAAHPPSRVATARQDGTNRPDRTNEGRRSEGGSPSPARESRALPSETRALPGRGSAVITRSVA
jgi:hypothetical protein